MSKPLITRTFTVPRELVFNAWVKPKQISQWLAPSGFVIAQDTIEVDPRIGGRYDYCLLEIDGGNTYWLHNKIIELIEWKLLVFASENNARIWIFRACRYARRAGRYS